MFGRVLAGVSAVAVAVAVTGCGVGPASHGGVESLAITGHAMGGQQPVSGANIFLYAASNGGYGAASVSKLTTSVSTDINGGFVLTSKYTCGSTDDLMYLVAREGNPGLSTPTNNPQIGLMAALGRCGDLLPTTNIILNEVTTVAAAWSLAQFMPTYDHLGTSSTNVTGLKNAFAMASNLASFARGQAPGDAPAGAVIPAAEVNTLANILLSCVNSTGGSAGAGNACGMLLTAATPSAGVAPTNTIDAALSIARNPGRNVKDIFALGAPTAAFQPSLTAQPNDWTMAVSFIVDTRSTNNMAIDANGNVLLVAGDGLFTLTPNGSSLGGNPLMAGQSVALDPTGNAWVTTAANALEKLAPNAITPSTYAANVVESTVVDGLAIDGTGSAWYTCASCISMYKMTGDGTFVGAFPTVPGTVHQTNVAVGSDSNVWLGNFDTPQVSVFQPSGVATALPYLCGTCGHPAFVATDGAGGAWITGNDVSHVNSLGFPTNYASAGGFFSPSAAAIDGGGNVWLVNPSGLASSPTGSLTELTSAGAAVSPDLGYLSDQLATPQSVAVDGSGNVWLRNTGSAKVTAFVGLGVPTTTPLSAAVAAGKIGVKP